MYNTGNPVPSSALEDMADNAQVFDGLVTKTSGTVTDRLGRTRRVFQQILMDMGFQPLAGSFQTGATITARNQTLYDEVSHVFYAWGGALPKVVPAGSTPATAGGVGAGAWVDRTQETLREELLSGPITQRGDGLSIKNIVSIFDMHSSAGSGDSTIDTSALQLAIATGESVHLGDGNTFNISSDITLSVKLYGKSTIAFASGFGFIISSGGELAEDVYVTGDKQNILAINASSLVSANVTTTGSQAASINSTGSDVIIRNAKLHANEYPVLVNSAAVGENLVVTDSLLISDKGDAIEINTPSNAFHNTSITNNVLSAGKNGSGSTAGFSIGIAGGKNVLTLGNMSVLSRKEAYHLEDASYGVLSVGNLNVGCRSDGALILNHENKLGHLHVGNMYIKDRDPSNATWNTGYGYYHVYDAKGTSRSDCIVGNYTEGFERGYSLGSFGVGVLNSNVSYDNTIGITTDTPSNVAGLTMIHKATYGVKGHGTIFGDLAFPDINTLTKPAIVSSNNTMGAALTGIRSKCDLTTVSAGYAFGRLLPCGATERFKGKMHILTNYGTVGRSGFFGSFDVRWDGSTLTVTDEGVSRNSGVFTLDSLEVNSNWLSAKVFCASGVVSLTLNFVFDGIFYSEGTV